MYEDLLKRIDYVFKDLRLLQQALTHRSAGSHNNERLEYLGDAVVNLVIADALVQRFPRAKEGELSRLRATLVNRDTLGNLGRQCDLGHYLVLGTGEIKTGGSARPSILSCAMEAILGAIYLDGGFAAAHAVILRLYDALLTTLPEAHTLKDPKTRLQEFLQSRGEMLPTYTVTATEGEGHQQVFTVTCVVGTKKTRADGTSRRKAEQAAATKMLEKMSHD